MISISVLCSWHRTPETLAISWVTLGGLLDEGWSPERLGHDEKLGIFSTPYYLEKGKGLKMELVIDHAYTGKSP